MHHFYLTKLDFGRKIAGKVVFIALRLLLRFVEFGLLSFTLVSVNTDEKKNTKKMGWDD